MRLHVLQDGSLWIAYVPTSFGAMEFLCGEGKEPAVKELLLLEKFLAGESDYIRTVRASAFACPFLWHPIRLAVNDEGRMGLQFKNRITGKQVGMFLADDHSAFKTRLDEIEVKDDDLQRLTGS